MSTATPDPSAPIPLAEAARYLGVRARGRPTHKRTLLRWSTRGLGGVRLETWMAGGVRMTSRAAVDEFNGKLTAARELARQRRQEQAAALGAGLRTGRQRQRAAEAARRKLEEMGAR